MPRTGQYRKGIARREQIIEAALRVIAEQGYRGATVQELSKAAGLAKTSLLHYFASREELLVEVLRRRDELDSAEFEGLSPQARAHQLVRTVRQNSEVPGLVQLFVRLSAEATSRDHPGHEYFVERYASARAAGADFIRGLQASGLLSSGADPECMAAIVVALIDGLQLQWLLDTDLDMGAILEHFLSVLALGARAETSTESGASSGQG
jgi:AcrR family transcriptional regulator